MEGAVEAAGGFRRLMALGLACSQLKTCKSGRESSRYYERVMRTSSAGRTRRGKKSDGTLPGESSVICLVIGGGHLLLYLFPVSGVGVMVVVRASSLK